MKKEAAYEPLQQQIERSFKLRESEEKTEDDKPKKLTRPVGPTLQVEERLKLKEGFMDDEVASMTESQVESYPDFKARPLKKDMFTKVDALPNVEKREKTSFEEF